jgi:hypothetical protein
MKGLGGRGSLGVSHEKGSRDMFIVGIALCGVVALTAAVYMYVQRRSAKAMPALAYAQPPSSVRVLRTRDEMQEVANRAYMREVNLVQAAQRRAARFAELTDGRGSRASRIAATPNHPALLARSTRPRPRAANE